MLSLTEGSYVYVCLHVHHPNISGRLINCHVNCPAVPDGTMGVGCQPPRCPGFDSHGICTYGFTVSRFTEMVPSFYCVELRTEIDVDTLVHPMDTRTPGVNHPCTPNGHPNSRALITLVHPMDTRTPGVNHTCTPNGHHPNSRR